MEEKQRNDEQEPKTGGTEKQITISPKLGLCARRCRFRRQGDNCGLSVTQSVVLPHAGRWFFAATACTRDGLESGFSEEVVWESLPAAPVVAGEPWVLLTPVLDCSTNLVNWRQVPGTATWWPATNRAEFFRVNELVIERVRRVVTP